jgi:hypothetical protein
VVTSTRGRVKKLRQNASVYGHRLDVRPTTAHHWRRGRTTARSGRHWRTPVISGTRSGYRVRTRGVPDGGHSCGEPTTVVRAVGSKSVNRSVDLQCLAQRLWAQAGAPE